MNILHVSYTDLVGSRFNGYCMQECLRETKHRVEMAVLIKESTNPHVYSFKPQAWNNRWLSKGIGRLVSKLLTLEGFLCQGGQMLQRQPCFAKADIVHLHLIHNGPLFGVLSLPRLSQLKPTVWTVHDSWAMTGLCVHPFECERWLTGCKGRCPHPRGYSPFRRYMAGLHWQIKRKAYQQIDTTLIAASRWMAERLKRSPLLGHLPVEVIAHGIDLKLFAPGSRMESRRALGIDPTARVIAFRGARVKSDQYKGIRWLVQALGMYAPRRPTCLLILDDGTDFRELRSKYELVELGWRDGARLAEVYRAADLFVMPSTQEAFGLMAVEAMACGTPVVVFEGTALPDVIQAPRGGLVVPTKDSAALARAIDLLLADDPLRERLGRQGRELCEEEYSAGLYVERHLRLYESVRERHRLQRTGEPVGMTG